MVALVKTVAVVVEVVGLWINLKIVSNTEAISKNCVSWLLFKFYFNNIIKYNFLKKGGGSEARVYMINFEEINEVCALKLYETVNEKNASVEEYI